MNTSSNSVAPWLSSSWDKIVEQVSADGLAHATLFAGEQGIGKHEFLIDITALLLCKEPADKACGHCHVCELLQAGTCPDFVWLTPEEDSQVIKIDAVREVLTFVYKTPQIARNKVVLIDPADALNVSAANALLKGLEEPPEHTYFLLASASPGRLPATIRSRCRQIRLSGPTEQQSREFLKNEFSDDQLDRVYAVMGSSPYEAVARGSSLTSLISSLDNLLTVLSNAPPTAEQASECLLTLDEWPLHTVLDIYVRMLNHLAKQSTQANVGDSSAERLAKNVPTASWIQLADAAQDTLQTVRRGISLNFKLTTESLLIALQETAKQSLNS